jgi:signal transduction histidine kinase
LLRNACDAMAGMVGERRVTVRTLLSFESPLGSPAGWVTVEVTDAGRGLGGRDIETLTAPFFSTKQEGTGLGLAICRSILESHAGVLYAQDGPAGGARFSFSLPPESLPTEATQP